jgi:uncharacterized protein (DUF2249 family)
MIFSMPFGAQKVEVAGATVDFYKFQENGTEIYYFNTSKNGHPMVNAMAGLKAIGENGKLVMINHHSPVGLFPKIEDNYDYEVENLDDGTVQVVFAYKIGTIQNTNFEDNHCGGGCDH